MGDGVDGKTISEQEFRHLCRTAAGIFIDEFGYVAAVRMGLYSRIAPSEALSMDGSFPQASREARIIHWKGDIWRQFEETDIDVLGILHEEWIQARNRLRAEPPSRGWTE